MSNDIQYTRYLNLDIFATEWRKYVRKTPVLNAENFYKEFRVNTYIKMDYVKSKTGKPVFIYLIATNSVYHLVPQNLKQLLNKIKIPADVILVTSFPFSSGGLKSIPAFKHLRVKMYLHETFSFILPNGPLCYPHRIMEPQEINTLLNSGLCCYLTNLPKISVSDPQCIWIGAEVGDVLEISMLSDISGIALLYKVVVAKNGKIISFRDPDVITEEKEADDELDDDVAEFHDVQPTESDYEDDDDTGSVK